MKRPFVEFAGTGSYAPPRVMTNDELSKSLDTSDEWIRERTGIRERRVAGPTESNACMSQAAAERAMRECGVDALGLDAGAALEGRSAYGNAAARRFATHQAERDPLRPQGDIAQQ